MAGGGLGGLAFAPAVYLWTARPQVLVHWSASGDVFVNTGAGGMQRVEFADGDGLAPLCYSTLEASACGAVPCRFDTPAGTVPLTDRADCRADPGIVLTLSRSPVTGPCSNTFVWSDVAAADGLTAHEEKDGVGIRVGAVCRNRPWKPCQS
ncbi:MAG: hypothetical protein VR74_07755 [Hyphomonas sp. BRH_c22]|nr:MAG: hypothetical protein VR74_07755 [Hyphomonas sp. BRH_c22]